MSNELASLNSTKPTKLAQLKTAHGVNFSHQVISGTEVNEPQVPPNTQYRKPYFRNASPLNDTYTRILEQKFRETDHKFKQQADRLVDDVRRFEEMNSTR